MTSPRGTWKEVEVLWHRQARRTFSLSFSYFFKNPAFLMPVANRLSGRVMGREMKKKLRFKIPTSIATLIYFSNHFQFWLKLPTVSLPFPFLLIWCITTWRKLTDLWCDADITLTHAVELMSCWILPSWKGPLNCLQQWSWTGPIGGNGSSSIMAAVCYHLTLLSGLDDLAYRHLSLWEG